MHGVENQIEPLKTRVMKADMFIAFSKKSPCLALIGGFGRKVGAMRANGVINNMLQNAIKIGTRLEDEPSASPRKRR